MRLIDTKIILIITVKVIAIDFKQMIGNGISRVHLCMIVLCSWCRLCIESLWTKDASRRLEIV